MPYLLARIQVRYGKLGRFVEIMSHLLPALEKRSWRLHGSFTNSIGKLNRVYDLWEVPDAEHVRSISELPAQDAEFAAWMQKLDDVVEEEVLEIMERLPLPPSSPLAR